MRGLIDAVSRLSGPLAYLAVGTLAGLEAAAFVGLVIPGELAMLLGGFLAFSGRVSLPVMAAVAAVAAVVGDSLGYEIGRRFGPALRASRLGARIGDARWERAERYVAEHGGKAVFLGRFVGVLRALVPAIAGTVGMPYRTFLPYNAAGGLIWAPGFVLLGYLAGASYRRVAAIAGQAGLVLAVLLVLVGGIGLAARWVVQHQDRVRAAVERQLARPAVVAVRRRYHRQLGFLADRLRPGQALGLSLTLGLALLLACGWAFGGILEDVLGRDELARVDNPVTSWLIDHRVAWLTRVMQLVTLLGSLSVALAVLAVTAVVAVLGTRRWEPAVLLAIVMAGTTALVYPVKLLVGRARPDIGEALVGPFVGSAFPSGHSAQAVACYGALAYLAARHARRWSVRVTVWTCAGVIALLVGFSRLYLGAHWLTDVLGGWALAGTWLTIVVTVVGTHERLRTERSRSSFRRPVGGADGAGGRP